MDLLARQQFLLMIRALYAYVEEEWEEMGKKFGVTPAQQMILFILSTQQGALTVSQISQLGSWHISTVTRLLKTLLERGWLVMSYDRTQSKNKYVTITPAGKQKYLDLAAYVKAKEDFPIDFSMLTQQELMTFMSIGDRVLNKCKDERLVAWVRNAKAEGVQY
ncbi:helix-turn-helix domain-containing protein [Paenibacillus methanolicus]|uniref:DNA-binding MarR family transcriptional regulator n=1 Tax=Paenibacillus methanolicus TaxID=582686 RepID=A0A5S5BTL9_9BACL|nr:helix-turn-helix domain-containing protein [Paenibacillus methanolicus]TYP69490.1 DNA-binding MarR family transcriptional regulator [Paenibacillus methanolicus]